MIASVSRAALGVAGLSALLFLSGCAARGGFVPPSGPGAPFPEFAQQFEEATKVCRGVRTLTAEASLSGRVAGQRARGKLHIGLAEPNALRLEAIAPFGQPVFVLVAQNGEGTLLLPRDNAAVKSAPAEELIDALAGLKLSPDELRAVATGCVAPAASATGGQRYPNGLTAITLGGESSAYIATRNGVPQIVAARRPGLTIEYDEFANGLPRRIRLRSASAAGSVDGAGAGAGAGDPRADLTLELAQVDLNVQLEPAAFKVDVPADARNLTLEELRRNGPLGRSR
jgi:outer membrane lipoprotein-sorting protein